MRSVLGIDAAWTEREPSGIALLADGGSGWSLIGSAASYAAFLGADPTARHRGSLPDAEALIAAAELKAGAAVDLVAIDMPLSLAPIVSRRVSDNLISSEYGARHGGTHTPSASRPGRLSDELRLAFDSAGYPLAVCGLPTRAVLEVYPHPALIELAAASRRLPYKQSKIRKYWPDESPTARRANLMRTWSEIVELLDAHVHGVKEALPLPSSGARGYELKAFEDTLDAVVCAWVGSCVMDGRARAFGDQMSAIWVPVISSSLPAARF